MTKTRLFKYIENFPSKNLKFSDKKKNCDIFHISAQNINCWYSLEPPRRGGSNEYPQSWFWAEIRKITYPCKPQFYDIKVGFKGSKLYKYVIVMITVHWLNVWQVMEIYRNILIMENRPASLLHVWIHCISDCNHTQHSSRITGAFIVLSISSVIFI